MKSGGSFGLRRELDPFALRSVSSASRARSISERPHGLTQFGTSKAMDVILSGPALRSPATPFEPHLHDGRGLVACAWYRREYRCFSIDRQDPLAAASCSEPSGTGLHRLCLGLDAVGMVLQPQFPADLDTTRVGRCGLTLKSMLHQIG